MDSLAEPLDLYAETAAAMIGLPIPGFCRAGVAENLAVLRRHAALVLDFPLSAEIEVPAVFRA